MTDLFIYLLINEHAGNHKAKKAAKKIKKKLKILSVPYDDYVTDYPGHALEIARTLEETKLKSCDELNEGERFPLLVILGGDGTIHEVINGVKRTTPIGYIPCGTGNDFARGMGISLKPLRALESILNCSAPCCRTVLIYKESHQKEKIAVNNIGLGLDANIVYSANHSRLKKILNVIHLGSLSYIVTIFHVLFTQKGFPISINVDDKHHSFSNAFLCTISNHPYFGGGVKILPPASVNDEHVNLIIVERISMIKILYLITQLIKGKHLESNYVYSFIGKNIEFSTLSREYMQIDGEDSERSAHDLEISSVCQEFWI